MIDVQDDMQTASDTSIKKIYGIFAGNIDQVAVQRLSSTIAIASQQGVQEVHILFQSSGGTAGDGICLYNIFSKAPLDIYLYNCGCVASVGVVAYLGALFRRTTKNAIFMVHRTTFSQVAATVDHVPSFASKASLEDRRVEEILHHEIILPQEKWDLHQITNLWLSAEEAIESSIADSIVEFSPPFGKPLFYFGS